MAEERNLGVARAAESDDVDTTKAELQRRMEEARESITQTVTEIKDTVANQYQAVRDTVTEALDWREQFRKRPVAFSVGALSAGFIVGYSVAGAFKGDGSDYEDEDYYPLYEESDAFAKTGARPAKLSSSPYEADSNVLLKPASSSVQSRGAQAVASGAYGSSGYEQAAPVKADYDTAEEAESDKPSLYERFKETRAYDKLQEEVSTLGDRFIEELSTVGTTVILPLIFGKIKDLFGVDLSNKEGRQMPSGTSASSGRGASPAASTGAQGTQSAGGASSGTAGASSAGARGAGSSYATSENRGYQTPSPDRT